MLINIHIIAILHIPLSDNTEALIYLELHVVQSGERLTHQLAKLTV